MSYADNKGADKPAHPCSLISAFVVCCLDSIIPVLAIAKNIKTLASLCTGVGQFESYLLKNAEDGLSRDVAQMSGIMRNPPMLYVSNREQDSLRSCAVWSAAVIHCLDSIMPLDTIPKISRLLLASVAEQAGSSLTWSQTSEDRFSRDVDQIRNFGPENLT